MKYKTRFAPSPTGMLHIGGVRTALFDYLAAKSTGGEFHLRIEDTDRERFIEGAVDAIHEGLAWLGIKSGGEVVYQSNRLPIYQKYADELVAKGLAYKCFCTPERLAKLKEEQESAKKPPVYDRCCLRLKPEEIAAKEKAGEKFVIRFQIPAMPESVTWTDKVRDKVSIPTNSLEDFILIKSDGWPTYNFANVIDDHEQDFNLIVRGDEFVPSTPKHILLYEALGWEHPEFAHVPVIVGTDMKKLSKRNGDTAISDYKDKGYLPEALLNFLVLLGWNPGTTEEIFTLAELEKKFSIDRVGKSPSVFDPERLDWMNGTYIRNLSVPELTDRLLDFDKNKDSGKADCAFLERVVAVEQSRLKTLAEFGEIAGFYWRMPKYASTTLVFKKSTPEATKTGLQAFLAAVSSFTENSWREKSVEGWNTFLADIVVKNGLTNSDVFWPIRVALSGQEKSASPAELLWVLGKKESLTRIDYAGNRNS
jgi:glutamyl-tRNA synthetase